MRVIAQKIEEINKKLIELTSRLEFIKLSYKDMDEEGKISFKKEKKEIEAKIALYNFEVEEAEKTISILKEKQREIDRLEDEWDMACCYAQGANSPRAQDLRTRINELEDEYCEKYNAGLVRLKGL